MLFKCSVKSLLTSTISRSFRNFSSEFIDANCMLSIVYSSGVLKMPAGLRARVPSTLFGLKLILVESFFGEETQLRRVAPEHGPRLVPKTLGICETSGISKELPAMCPHDFPGLWPLTSAPSRACLWFCGCKVKAYSRTRMNNKDTWRNFRYICMSTGASWSLTSPDGFHDS